MCECARFANAPISDTEKDDDLKALDLADEEVAARLPVLKEMPLEKPKVKKPPKKKSLRHKLHQHMEPLPDEKTKSSVLWAHDREMKFADEAAKVLEAGDQAAASKIREEKEAHQARVAPAKVVHVSDKELEAAKKAGDDALEGSRDMEQDLKDLKERAEDEESEDKKKKEEEKEEKLRAKVEAEEKENATVTKKPEKPIDLDHLVKLSSEMKNDAENSTAGGKNKTAAAFVQEAPATADHRFTAMKNLAESVRKAKAKASEPEETEVVAQAAAAEPKAEGEMTPDKVQRLKALAGKMQNAVSSRPGAGIKAVDAEASAQQAAADEGELADGEEIVAIPQANFSGPPVPQFSTKYAPQTIATKAFKGSGLKNEVKQAAKDFHNKIAEHVVNMHTALRDHAIEMENKAKQAKIDAQMEAARKAREAAEEEARKKQEAEEAAIAAQKAAAKEAADQALREKAERVQQENTVAGRAQKAMHEQAAQSQQKSVSKAELKARDDAHQKMLAYREQQRKEREEQQRQKEMIAKDALEAEKAAETLRALEHELPIEEEKPKKSGAAALATMGCLVLGIVFGSH